MPFLEDSKNFVSASINLEIPVQQMRGHYRTKTMVPFRLLHENFEFILAFVRDGYESCNAYRKEARVLDE